MYNLKSKEEQQLYTNLVDKIKVINSECIALRNSKQYKVGLVVTEIAKDISHFKLKELRKNIKNWKNGSREKKKDITQQPAKSVKNNSNYFSEHRIAVYTAVFGNYDTILEPLLTPDNCDFYVFTDQELKNKNSVWKKKEIPNDIASLDNVSKNRYLKMHPHELFDDYEYSIYVDGNIQIISDLTEYINELNELGIGIHKHKTRNCVYDELEIIVKNGKETRTNALKHKEYLEQTNMPKNYGLFECGIIVRQHHNPLCIELMEDWWNEFSKYTKRDQISLPHVLFMHEIPVEKLVIFNSDIQSNASFRFLRHQ